MGAQVPVGSFDEEILTTLSHMSVIVAAAAAAAGDPLDPDRVEASVAAVSHMGATSLLHDVFARFKIGRDLLQDAVGNANRHRTHARGVAEFAGQLVKLQTEEPGLEHARLLRELDVWHSSQSGDLQKMVLASAEFEKAPSVISDVFQSALALFVMKWSDTFVAASSGRLLWYS